MAAKTKTTEKPRAYILRGDDDYQKRKHLEKLLKSLVSKDFEDFDSEQMDGNSATADRIMSGLNVPPFASEQRVVLVRHANKMNEAEQQKLASQLPKAPASGCLILVTPAPEKVDGKPRKGSEVIGDLSRAVRKIGSVEEFGKMKKDAAIRFAQSLFTQAGKKIDASAIAHFIQRVGCDSSVISTEAQKLIDYSGDSGTINAQSINTVTSETPEEKIFKLVDAVSVRNAAEALGLLDEMFTSGDDPGAEAPKTLAVLSRQFRLLWQVKLLTGMGINTFDKNFVPENIKAMLPSDPNVLDVIGRQSWMVDRILRQARPFTHKDLVHCFDAISRADLMLKGIEGGIEDPRMVMELLVVGLTRRDTRR